ncbi:MAG: AEC family transporter [bacterium]
MNSVIIRTLVPIFLLIGLGFFSRFRGYLKQGDERVLSAYLYWFALPALFFVILSETIFTSEMLRFIVAAVIPLFIALILYMLVGTVLRWPRIKVYLLILGSIFGSVAFFGIPFIMFAFPSSQIEQLAVVAAAFISAVAVVIVIFTLELNKLSGQPGRKFFKVILSLVKNPLILSISLGIVLSLLKIVIPLPLASALHMLGKTTATVAVFMLGVFLYGRNYTNIFRALKLSLLRVFFLPTIALLTVTWLQLPPEQGAIVVLMHAMPLAVSMIVLSDRYDFEQETIASLILISSLGAALYLNIWLFVLGIK